MSQDNIRRLTAVALIVGGVLNLIFILNAGRHLIGEEAPLTTGYSIAHQAHLYAALAFLIAVFGLYYCVLPRTDSLWGAGMIFSLLGNGMFTATGVYTAYLIPDICRQAPQLFADPRNIVVTSKAFMFTVLSYGIGWSLTGILCWRHGFPRLVSASMILGAVLDVLPPEPWGPFPWLTQDLSGIFMLIGTVGVAWSILRGTHREPAEAAAHA